nr:twin-arginine translocase TatA/TatE family subunit [Rhizobium laguerreae]
MRAKAAPIFLDLVIVLILFGRGKIPELMADVAHGIKAFKKGMQDDHVRVGNDATQPERSSERARDNE